MNWMDDATGFNDTGTGPDQGVDGAARAACERVSRRMAHQQTPDQRTPDAKAWQSAQAKALADEGRIAEAKEAEINYLRYRLAAIRQFIEEPTSDVEPPATQNCPCGGRGDCPHCFGRGWYVFAGVTCPGCAGQGCTYCNGRGRVLQAIPPGEPRENWASKAAAHAAATLEAKAVYEGCARRGLKSARRITGPSDSPPPGQPSSDQTSSEWTTPSELMNGYFASTRKWGLWDWLWALFWGQQMKNLFNGRQGHSGLREKLENVRRRGLH
jgi:hypothetical protein